MWPHVTTCLKSCVFMSWNFKCSDHQSVVDHLAKCSGHIICGSGDRAAKTFYVTLQKPLDQRIWWL